MNLLELLFLPFFLFPPPSIFILGILLGSYALSKNNKSKKGMHAVTITAALMVLYGVVGGYLDFIESGEDSIVAYLFYSFTYNPLLTLGAVFGAIYFLSNKRLLAKTTVALWALYAIYEFILMPKVICPEGCNIRVDLVLIYPVLLIFSAVSIATVLKKKK